jgi:geranyl-CoA carboxylase alpha subunit
MGDKRWAKAHLTDVPFVPGYFGDDQSYDTLIREAERVGYPIMVKAAAGGGGRGMRLVHRSADLTEALASARREAEQAFGSGSLMLERALMKNRDTLKYKFVGDQHGHICRPRRARMQRAAPSSEDRRGSSLHSADA